MCSGLDAFFWSARLSVNTFERTSDFPTRIAEGRAAIIYGGDPRYHRGPESAALAWNELTRLIVERDRDERYRGSSLVLPYELTGDWACATIHADGKRDRRRPFGSVDEELENTFEATPEILANSAK